MCLTFCVPKKSNDIFLPDLLFRGRTLHTAEDIYLLILISLVKSNHTRKKINKKIYFFHHFHVDTSVFSIFSIIYPVNPQQ